MTVTVVGAGTQVSEGQPRSVKSYTGNTATALQSLDPTYDVHNLGMSTAATVGVNRYLLATDSNYENRTLIVQATATGTASLVLTGTSTGMLIFAAATDIVRLRQFNGVWSLEENTGATVATATGSA